jgi:hypothetical protein
MCELEAVLVETVAFVYRAASPPLAKLLLPGRVVFVVQLAVVLRLRKAKEKNDKNLINILLLYH